MKSVVLMLLLLVVPRSVRTDEESSDVYLRNVVEELQFLNGVVPSERSTRVSYPSYDDTPSETSVEATSSDVVTNHYQHQLPPQKYLFHLKQMSKTQRHSLPRNPTYLLEPPPPQQPPPPQPQAAPPILGFTAAELASMYRKAMERGVPVKHHHNPVPEYSFDRPKVVPALRVQQPGYGSDYAYYFYPLNSFRHELEKQNTFHYSGVPEGYHTLPDAAYAATTIIDPNKKETSGTSIMSHIITGVSSFIGMAIFFIFSMFIYPRFLHMMHFPFATTSRMNFRNEFSHLAAFVTEAIDIYNQNTRQKFKHQLQR